MVRELSAPLLLTATALGVVLFFRRRMPSAEMAPWRAAIVQSAVVLGVFVVASIEGLSALGALRTAPLAVVWSALLVTAWTVVVVSPRREAAGAVSASPRRAATDVLATVGVCVVFATVTLVIAVVAPPNNWDSMTYHMARVAHWLANGSVRHYPVAYPVQLFMPPFAGYGIATLQSLAGTDRWANTVQWAAYVVAAIAASLLAARIGARPRAQALAALALMTVPIAVSEASTTQTDMVAAAALVMLFVFVVGTPTRENALWAGAALGLGLGAKMHVPMYALPACLLLVMRYGRDRGRFDVRRAVATSAVVALVALVLVAPHFLRNVRTFGRPWGAGVEVERQRATPGVTTLASNVLRDSALQLPIPGYGRAVERLHRALGIDPNDPKTTHYYDLSFSDVAAKWYRPLTPNEDFVGNPMHFVLALAFAAVAVARRRRWDATARAAVVIGATVTAGWLVFEFSAKWQPWSTRYDLPLFAVLAVPLGVGLARVSPRVRAILTGALVVGALPALLLDVHRPLVDLEALAAWPSWTWSAIGVVTVAGGASLAVGTGAYAVRSWFVPRVAAIAVAMAVLAPIAIRLGAKVFARQPAFPPLSIVGADRTHVMFRGNPAMEAIYVEAVDRVRASGCDVVGLEVRRDAWEYPLWAMLGAEAAGAAPRLRAVVVENETARLPAEAPEPCVVVSSATPSAFDDRPGWSREVLSSDPFFAVHSRVETRS